MPQAIRLGMAKPRRFSGREIKQRLAALLEAEDFHPALGELREVPGRRVLRSLLSFLCEANDERKWRAVSAMGPLAADLARDNMEEARELMRRLMWMLNEESGMSGWGAPEAMAEIMAVHEGLAQEYAHMLVSYLRQDGNYLENPLLQRGLLWGVGRLAQARPGLMRKHDAAACLAHFLESADPAVRGLAAWCAGILKAEQARPALSALLGEDTEVVLYRDHRASRFRVGGLAEEALARLDGRT